MTRMIGDTTVFTAYEPPDPGEFDERMALLLRGTPDYVWVKNTGTMFYHWEVTPLYLNGDIIVLDVGLSLGSYRLTLRSGSKIVVSDGQILVQGDGYLKKTGYSHPVTNICINIDGTIDFDVKISSEALAIGLWHFSDAYDEHCRTKVADGVFSKLFQSCDLSLHATFAALSPDKNQFVLSEEVECPTCFTTIYGAVIHMRFPRGFGFVMQPALQFYEPQDYYLAPTGTAGVLTAGKLMLGLSGAEYIVYGQNGEMTFVPGQKSFYKSLQNHTMPCTSYIWGNGIYHAQPQGSCFYHEGTGVRIFAELPGAAMPKDAALPAFPYRQCEGNGETAQHLETDYLAPARCRVMETAVSLSQKGEDSQLVSNRHGLKVLLSSGSISWLSLAELNRPEPCLALTSPSDRLMLGFEANDLFMAVTSAEQLLTHAGTPFCTSELHLAIAEKNGYPQEAAQKLRETMCDRIFKNEAEFHETVGSFVPYNNILRDACDNFIIETAGWRFRLTPGYYETYDTIMVIKLHGSKSIAELAKQPDVWSFAPDATGAARVKRIVQAAVIAADEFNNPSLKEVLHDPGWRGTVFFNVGIELNDLPGELSFFIEGIQKPEDFKALYLAFPAIHPGKQQDSRIMALLDYRDEQHLFDSNYRSYDFKLLRLQMEIRGNTINHFSARVELLINSLFGGRTLADENEAGNNLLFGGSYQKDEMGGGRYIFAIERPQAYHIDGSGLAYLIVEKAAMQTGGEICRFVLGGSAGFYNTGEFDLFSYDKLKYGGLTIEMRKSDPGYTFRFLPQDMFFLPELSNWRGNSLTACFPISPLSMLVSSGTPVKQSGYTRLNISGIPPSELSCDWYGIVWQVEIGDLGGLAAGMLANIELLTAWSAQENGQDGKPDIYAGLRFGASGSDDGYNLPLQGVLSLGFDAIELHHEKKNEDMCYYFQFKNFSVKLLGMRFPYTNNDMFLVSDGSRGIGWYGVMEG